jgi:branched-chain amino acid transport system substrate-binding protein
MKIGVLLPHSKQYKTMDRDFIRGLKVNNLEIQYCIESIGIGADETLIIDKMQKMHLQEDITIMIGFFGHHNISTVYQYAIDNDIILIASDLGATLPYGTAHLNGVYINSFGLAESAYLLGKYLNEQGVKNIATSFSYYDSGYGLLEAIEDSFEDSTCQFSGHYITPFVPRENESQYMQETIDCCASNVVFASHSGIYAKEHTDCIAETDLLKKNTYYTTPFTITKEIASLENLQKVQIVGSWIENATNQADIFIKEYDNLYRSIPTIFALLGHESGLILKKLFENSKKTSKNIHEIMKTLEVNGPRGLLHFKNGNRTFFNHHIYRAIKNEEHQELKFEIIETLTNEGDFMNRIAQKTTFNKIGGWQNAYLCH